MHLGTLEYALRCEILLFGGDKDNRFKGGDMGSGALTCAGSQGLICDIKCQGGFTNATNAIYSNQISCVVGGEEVLQLLDFCLTSYQSRMLHTCQSIGYCSEFFHSPQFVQ